MVQRAFEIDPAAGAAPGLRRVYVSRGTLCVQLVDAVGIDLALPDAAAHATAPHITYVIEPWHPPLGSGRYRVRRDGVVRYLGSDADRLRAWIRADLARLAARRAPAGLLVHAAVLRWRHVAILIPGAGRGTATLAAALAAAGADPLAGRAALLDDDGRVVIAAGGRAPALPVGLVVDTVYRPELAFRPRELRGAPVALPIVTHADATRSDPAHALRVAARLARGAVALHGPRGEAARAAPRILAALENELERRRGVTPGAGLW